MQSTEYSRLYAAEEKLWWFRALHLSVLNLLPKQSGANVLDIGCGTGGLMQRLRREGYAVNGVDYAPEAVQFAHSRAAGPVAQASANAIPFADASFDLVTCIDLLEVATVDPQALVRNALRVLRPGGYGLFVMAAHQWLLSEHDRAVNSVRRFDLRQMRELFREAPAQIMRGTYLFFLLFPLVVIRKLANRPKAEGQSQSDVSVPPSIVNEPLYWLCWLEAQWLRAFNLPMGSSVVVMVRKHG